MTLENGYLIVGGDSLVGNGLLNALERRRYFVLASTRRKDTLGEKRIYLNLEEGKPFKVPREVSYVFVVAAATNYERCETDPLAQKINVELIPRLVLSLLDQGVFVTFISTNSVFGGERPWPEEDDSHAPGIAYAAQKHKAERIIRDIASRSGMEHHFNIVRLTKVLDRNTSPLPAWYAAWSLGKTIEPFADLIFAPISLQFVGESLASISEQRTSGNLHLSGAENISYVDLAESLARAMSIPPRLIIPTTADAKGVSIKFKPRFSGLGMARTTQLTGLKPQLLRDVVRDLTS